MATSPKKRAYLDIEDRFNNVESSEESDSGSDDELDGGGERNFSILITEKLLNEWRVKIDSAANQAVIHDVIHGFASAVEEINDKSGSKESVVKSSSIFNDLIKLCFTRIPPALQKFLELPKTEDIRNATKPKRSPKWTQVRVDIQIYLHSLLKMISCIAEASMLDIVLKHVLKMIQYYSMYNKLSKLVLKKMIYIWSTGEETTRVLAFLCINRLINMSPGNNTLTSAIKRMYMEFVKNCKFTSPTLLPMIKFMQMSFVEILKIDEKLTYQHAFIYIRQQAIHLRNALMTKKKDLCLAIYNWQYIRCLELWSRLVASVPGSPTFEHLIYPLVQIITGTINLIPSVSYYPLRFHCAAMLNLISASTGKFVPVIPFIIETLDEVDLNKRQNQKMISKPLNFTCILKLTNAQTDEKSFKDALIDQVYEHLLVHMNIYANSVSFPELVFPMQTRLKAILKSCKIPAYTKQIKQILDKAEDNSKFITERRKDLTVKLADAQAIDAWERQCKAAKPPVSKYYESWKKLRERELMHQMAAKDTIIGHDNFQEIKAKKEFLPKASQEDREEFSKLFEVDDDESSFADIFNINVSKLREEGTKERKKKKLKNKDQKKLKKKQSKDKDSDNDCATKKKKKKDGPSKKKKLKVSE